MEDVYVLNIMMEIVSVAIRSRRETQGDEKPSPREAIERIENILMLNLKRTIVSDSQVLYS